MPYSDQDHHNLCQASEVGRIDLVREIFQRNPDMIRSGNKALRICIMEGHVFLLDFMISQGVDVHEWGDDALTQAAIRGSLVMVKSLLAAGCAPDHTHSEAMRRAAREGHLDVVQHLVERGADPTALDDDAIYQSAKHGHWAVVSYLAAKGASTFRGVKGSGDCPPANHLSIAQRYQKTRDELSLLHQRVVESLALREAIPEPYNRPVRRRI